MLYFYSCYLPVVNIIAFVLMLVDKSRAKGHKSRIRERTLFGAALLGGCLGGLLGMYFANHKTRHRLFAVGLPLLTILYGILLVFVWYWFHR